MFWGWGSTARQKKISETQIVYNRYKYFHMMFINRVTWGYIYILSTLNQDGWSQKEITKEEAVRLMSGDELMPNWWARYSLYGLLATIFLVVVWSLVASIFSPR